MRKKLTYQKVEVDRLFHKAKKEAKRFYSSDEIHDSSVHQDAWDDANKALEIYLAEKSKNQKKN